MAECGIVLTNESRDRLVGGRWQRRRRRALSRQTAWTASPSSCARRRAAAIVGRRRRSLFGAPRCCSQLRCARSCRTPGARVARRRCVRCSLAAVGAVDRGAGRPQRRCRQPLRIDRRVDRACRSRDRVGTARSASASDRLGRRGLRSSVGCGLVIAAVGDGGARARRRDEGDLPGQAARPDAGDTVLGIVLRIGAAAAVLPGAAWLAVAVVLWSSYASLPPRRATSLPATA